MKNKTLLLLLISSAFSLAARSQQKASDKGMSVEIKKVEEKKEYRNRMLLQTQQDVIVHQPEMKPSTGTAQPVPGKPSDKPIRSVPLPVRKQPAKF